MPGTVRLDRALSKLGLASRARARRLIDAGEVRVHGRIVCDPAALVTPETAQIELAGKPSVPSEWRTIALNKPRGVLTTRHDPQGRRTIFDLLGSDGASLVAVGRLDQASTGLLLLTTETQLANWLTSPDSAVVRRYVVTVRGFVSDDAARRMESGLGGLRAKAVVIRKRSRRETHLLIELTEGRNREIRRLLDAVGHEVTRLLRIAVGGIELGPLQAGEWREVTRDELDAAFPAWATTRFAAPAAGRSASRVERARAPRPTRRSATRPQRTRA
jgi:23S rRNA pseudouridine2605 synthase